MEKVDLMYLSPELVRELDRAVGDAIGEVQNGAANRERVAKASVALSFDVALDEDAQPVVGFTHKHTRTRKGTWMPTNAPRLKFE